MHSVLLASNPELSSLSFRTIVALVYNVLKTLMEMNGKLFDNLTSSYKAERQREKKKELEREELWKKLEELQLKKTLVKQNNA